MCTMYVMIHCIYVLELHQSIVRQLSTHLQNITDGSGQKYQHIAEGVDECPEPCHLFGRAWNFVWIRVQRLHTAAGAILLGMHWSTCGRHCVTQSKIFATIYFRHFFGVFKRVTSQRQFLTLFLKFTHEHE